MEYTNDEVFKIRYNTKMNRLEMRKDRWTSRIAKMLKKHKFMSSIFIALVLFSIVNVVMIYQFIEILQNV